VVTLPSGLQYKILFGRHRVRSPRTNSTVEIVYRGTLVDGTEFENSFGTGKTATLQSQRDDAGWNEALKLMPAGSKWRLFLPAALAYGRSGKPGGVGPNGGADLRIGIARGQVTFKRKPTGKTGEREGANMMKRLLGLGGTGSCCRRFLPAVTGGACRKRMGFSRE